MRPWGRGAALGVCCWGCAAGCSWDRHLLHMPSSSLRAAPHACSPVGTTCNSGVSSPALCSADQYQPYLGGASCLTCNSTATPRLTSSTGDAYCTLPYVDASCSNGGRHTAMQPPLPCLALQPARAWALAHHRTACPCPTCPSLTGYEYDADTSACVQCPAGTQRKVGREDYCVAWCAAGTLQRLRVRGGLQGWHAVPLHLCGRLRGAAVQPQLSGALACPPLPPAAPPATTRPQAPPTAPSAPSTSFRLSMAWVSGAACGRRCCGLPCCRYGLPHMPELLARRPPMISPAAERTTGTQKCIYCPAGSVAITDAGTVGQQGSTSCDPWCAVQPCVQHLTGSFAVPANLPHLILPSLAAPRCCSLPGKYSAIVNGNNYATCEDCPEGYFRSGDASPGNNACRQIPAGYKEKARSGTTYDRAELELCSKGEVSFWTGGIRTPLDAQACQPCTGNNKYAQRQGEDNSASAPAAPAFAGHFTGWLPCGSGTGAGGSRLPPAAPCCAGMSACLPCPGGTYPTKSASSPVGNDQCTKCADNKYRSFDSTSATCLTCTAGREVFPSGNTMCAPW